MSKKFKKVVKEDRISRKRAKEIQDNFYEFLYNFNSAPKLVTLEQMLKGEF